ncbi:helix-turn-helix domain-containing protein [Streptomyces sp. RG80]|uniref:TetR/AcrR family transcriptional regulator n=1 Tax=Streptomyces sp. RG80 TaxID=3157340 RepID=UPI0033900913
MVRGVGQRRALGLGHLSCAVISSVRPPSVSRPSGTARGLSAGFDRVTVAEVARVAQVSEATVFNSFPAKEDLFSSRFEAFGERLVEAVRTRPPGESAPATFRRRLLASEGLLTRMEAGEADALD